jgi:hypothetical protein
MRMQQLLSGFEVSQALYVIAELGVATALLDGPRSVDDLAAATGADVDALGRIIRFLASLDVFRRQANRGGHRPRPDAPRRPHRFDQGDPPVRPPGFVVRAADAAVRECLWSAQVCRSPGAGRMI